jgi:hypothetical protein
MNEDDIWIRKTKMKRSLGMHRQRLEDNITMILKKIRG